MELLPGAPLSRHIGAERLSGDCLLQIGGTLYLWKRTPTLKPM